MDPGLNILQTWALRQNNTRPIVNMPKLSNTVLFQIKQKILPAKYIKIKELFQLNTQSHIESTKLRIQTSEDGLPILVQVPTKKKPVSFSEYQAGWRVYKVVYLEKYPSELQAMLVSENDISSFASQGLDCIRYDEAFKKGREMNRYPWDTLRPDLEKNLHQVFKTVFFGGIQNNLVRVMETDTFLEMI